MENSAFRKLVAALEGSPVAFQALLTGDTENKKLTPLLDDATRAAMRGISVDQKIAALVFDASRHLRIDNGCVDSCEASRSFAGDFVMSGCAASCGDTCGPSPSCAHTSEGAVDAGRFTFEQAGCGPDTTCSCTSGTCGGATCGGSTCSATCTGDSCGNTCGNSCDWTSNLQRPGNLVSRFSQFSRWR